MIEAGWIVVCAGLVAAAYDVARRVITGAKRAELEAFEKRLADHEKLFADICLQWRTKVTELERKCDQVVVNAQNEIAGSLASVADITKKGWR